MIAWERWPGANVGNKYSLERLLAADGNHAWFMARSLQSPSESIVFSFQPAEREIAGWPSYILGLRHPHLRKVLGAGKQVIEDREWLCVAMERTDSLLADRLSGQDSLPVEVVRDLTAQLVDALRYLHGKNLVCRNLKPETIAAVGDTW
jgi:serine/threonine protein kinase